MAKFFLQCRRLGFHSWVGKIPGEGMGIHSCIPAWRIQWTRGAWQATVHGVTKSQTGLSYYHAHIHTHTQATLLEMGKRFVLFVLFVLFHVLFEPAPNDRHCFLLIEPICKLVEYSRSSGRNLSKLYLNYLIYD